MFVLDRKVNQEILVELDDGRQILIALIKIDAASGARIGITADKSIQIRKAEVLQFADFGNGERRALVPKRQN